MPTLSSPQNGRHANTFENVADNFCQEQNDQNAKQDWSNRVRVASAMIVVSSICAFPMVLVFVIVVIGCRRIRKFGGNTCELFRSFRRFRAGRCLLPGRFDV